MQKQSFIPKPILQSMVKNSTLTCPICWTRLTRPAHINSCLHRYCYKCILGWSQYKNNCPLCLKHFTHITHRTRRLRKQMRPFRRIKVDNTPKKVKNKVKKRVAGEQNMDMCEQEEILRIFESPDTRGNTQRVLSVISMIENLLLEM